jgi:hypothetical protein
VALELADLGLVSGQLPVRHGKRRKRRLVTLPVSASRPPGLAAGARLTPGPLFTVGWSATRTGSSRASVARRPGRSARSSPSPPQVFPRRVAAAAAGWIGRPAAVPSHDRLSTHRAGRVRAGGPWSPSRPAAARLAHGVQSTAAPLLLLSPQARIAGRPIWLG